MQIWLYLSVLTPIQHNGGKTAFCLYFELHLEVPVPEALPRLLSNNPQKFWWKVFISTVYGWLDIFLRSISESSNEFTKMYWHTHTNINININKRPLNMYSHTSGSSLYLSSNLRACHELVHSRFPEDESVDFDDALTLPTYSATMWLTCNNFSDPLICPLPPLSDQNYRFEDTDFIQMSGLPCSFRLAQSLGVLRAVKTHNLSVSGPQADCLNT